MELRMMLEDALTEKIWHLGEESSQKADTEGWIE